MMYKRTHSYNYTYKSSACVLNIVSPGTRKRYSGLESNIAIRGVITRNSTA